MTNYYENLDAILTVYRINYLKAYQSKDYITSAQILYDMNQAHPPEAYLEDMPHFTISKIQWAGSLGVRLSTQNKAKTYCDLWNGRMNQAMSVFRAKNQEAYNRI